MTSSELLDQLAAPRLLGSVPRTELEWLRRQPKARTGKQKARIQRAETAKSAPPPKAERTAQLSVEAVRTGKTILELKKLGLSLDGRWLVRGLDFTLTKGERVGIVGRNGTGKTTMIRAILGQLGAEGDGAAAEGPRMEGEVVLGKNTSVAYFDQHRSGLDLDKSIFENIAGSHTRVEVGGRSMDVRSYLERFLFDPNKARQPSSHSSVGEPACQVQEQTLDASRARRSRRSLSRCAASAVRRAVTSSAKMATPPIAPSARCHGTTSHCSHRGVPSALVTRSTLARSGGPPASTRACEARHCSGRSGNASC